MGKAFEKQRKTIRDQEKRQAEAEGSKEFKRKNSKKFKIQKKTKVLHGFQSKIFPIKKTTQGTGLKILTAKQMRQRLPIALAEVKAGNTSVNLLNEIC